ncbi:MAG TPA: NPCBM/NEW2 domain-containing protein, partial [Gaiellaceae bacterium]
MTLFAFSPVVGAGAAPPAVMKITASAVTSVIVGGRVAVKGRVSPRLAGVRVTIEERLALGWKAVATRKTVGGGLFSFPVRPTKAGNATYRIVAPGGGTAPAMSANVVIDVLEWTFLSDIYAHPSAGDLSTDPIISNGVSFANPVSLDAGCYNAWGGDAWVDYPLGHRYATLTASVGIGDSPAASSTASFKVIGDGKILSSGNLVLGALTKIKVSLAGVGRMQIRVNVPDP